MTLCKPSTVSGVSHTAYRIDFQSPALKRSQQGVKNLFDRFLEKNKTRHAAALGKPLSSIEAHPLNRNLFCKDAHELRLMAEQWSEEKLWPLVLASRENSNIRYLSANAISILNAKQVSFSGKDLHGIQVRHAMLEGGVFYRANLDKADLSETSVDRADFSYASCREANFTDIKLSELGHIPIEFKSSKTSLGRQSIPLDCFVVHDLLMVTDRILLAALGDGNLMFYDIHTRHLVEKWESEKGAVYQLCHDPKRNRLVAICEGGVEIWDTKTKTRIANFSQKNSPHTTQGYVCSDGSFITLDKIYRRYDLIDEKMISKISLSAEKAVIIDDEQLIYADDKGTISLARIAKNKHSVVRTLYSSQTNEKIEHLAWHPESRRLAILTDRSLILRNLEHENATYFKQEIESPTKMIFSTNGSSLIIGTGRSGVFVVDAMTGISRNYFEIPDAVGSLMCIGDHLLVGEGYSEIQFFVHTNSQKSIRFFDMQHVGISDKNSQTSYRRLALHPNQNKMALFPYSGDYIEIRSLDRLDSGKKIPVESGNYAAVFHPTLPLLMLSWGPFRVLNYDTGELLFEGSEALTGRVAIHPKNPKQMFVGYKDGISVIDIDKKKRVKHFPLDSWPTTFALSADGKRLAIVQRMYHTEADPNTFLGVKTWESKIGSSYMIHEDGAIGTDRWRKVYRLALWDTGEDGILSRPKLLDYPLEHTSEIANVAFSPDSKFLAMGTHSGDIFVWDFAQKKKILVGDHKDVVTGLQFSPDGQCLISSGDNQDRLLKFWSTTTWGLVHEIECGDEIGGFDLDANGMLAVSSKSLVEIFNLKKFLSHSGVIELHKSIGKSHFLSHHADISQARIAPAIKPALLQKGAYDIQGLGILYGQLKLFFEKYFANRDQQSLVLEALKLKDWAKLQNCLTAGISPDEGRTNEGKTALHLAAEGGYLEAVKLLLLHGADVHIRTPLGLRAITMAHMNTKHPIFGEEAKEIVALLRAKYKNPMHADSDILLNSSEDSDSVSVLMERLSEALILDPTNCIALHLQAKIWAGTKQPEQVLALFQKYLGVTNLSEVATLSTQFFWLVERAISDLVEKGNTHHLEFYLRMKGDPNIFANFANGQNLIHIAQERGDKFTESCLLRHGASNEGDTRRFVSEENMLFRMCLYVFTKNWKTLEGMVKMLLHFAPPEGAGTRFILKLMSVLPDVMKGDFLEALKTLDTLEVLTNDSIPIYFSETVAKMKASILRSYATQIWQRKDIEEFSRFVDANLSFLKQTPIPGEMSWLLIAVGFNRVDLVQKVLEQGADLNATSKQGITALFQACRNKNTDIVNLLKAAHPNPTAAEAEIEAGQVSDGFDIETLEKLLQKSPNYFLALQLLSEMYSVAGKSFDAIKLAERFLANSEVENIPKDQVIQMKVALQRYQRAYLCQCVREGNLSLLKIGLEGVDINTIRNDYGKSLLYVATEVEKPAVIQELIQRGASLDIRSDLGFKLTYLPQAWKEPIKTILAPHIRHLEAEKAIADYLKLDTVCNGENNTIKDLLAIVSNSNRAYEFSRLVRQIEDHFSKPTESQIPDFLVVLANFLAPKKAELSSSEEESEQDDD